MNNYAKRMMMEKMMDTRNPYGRRGGYSDRSEGDYRYDNAMGSDNRYNGRSSGGRSDNAYSQSDAARFGGDYKSGMVYYDGYGPSSYASHDSFYGAHEDMMSDMHAPKLTQKDIKKWEKKLENADGTRGAKYETHQLMPLIERLNIRFDEYSPELFTAIVNMMYSDYCKVLGSDPMLYIKLAKAFLDDDDFSGEPAEKAMLYYKCIVEKEDD